MNQTIKTVENVINSDLLIKELVFIPKSGSTKETISEIENKLNFLFDENYKAFLTKWDGADLDVVRVFSMSPKENALEFIMTSQEDRCHDMIAFASDPAGFLYLFNTKNEVISYDHDGGTMKKISPSFEDFICNYIFGTRAAEFAGEEWVAELKNAGLIGD